MFGGKKHEASLPPILCAQNCRGGEYADPAFGQGGNSD